MRRLETFAALKDGGRDASADGRAGRARDILVAAEVAMATVLLVGAGLLVRTRRRTAERAGRLRDRPICVTARDRAAEAERPQPRRLSRCRPAASRFYREALRRVAALPGVERAAMSSQIPLGGFNPPLFIEIDGRDAGEASVRPVVHNFQVSPGYFDTMGVRIVSGPAVHRVRPAPAASRSRSSARPPRACSGRIEIRSGGRLRFAPDTPWMTVVGVAGDVLNRRLTEPPQPILYRSLEQSSDLSMASADSHRAAITRHESRRERGARSQARGSGSAGLLGAPDDAS